jgi:hypothetical protein
MYDFAPEKPPSLVERNFYLAISGVFARASLIRYKVVIPECLYRGSSLFNQTKSGFPIRIVSGMTA